MQPWCIVLPVLIGLRVKAKAYFVGSALSYVQPALTIKDNRYSSLPQYHKHCIPKDSVSVYHEQRGFRLGLPSNHRPMWTGPLVLFESHL